MGLYEVRFHVGRCMIFLQEGLGIWTQHILFTRYWQTMSPHVRYGVFSRLFCFSGSYMYEIPMLDVLITIWRHMLPVCLPQSRPMSHWIRHCQRAERNLGMCSPTKSSVATRFREGPYRHVQTDPHYPCRPLAINFVLLLVVLM